MIKQYFNDMVLKMEATLIEKNTARQRFNLEITRLGQRIYSGSRPLALCGVCAPFDLLKAMGINSCFVEFWGGVLASAGIAGPFMEEAAHAGFQSEGCGWHRTVIGAAVKGMIPRPDVMIGTSSPCAGGLAAVEHLARRFGSPLFVLTIPPDDSEKSVQYLADQFRSMVDFVTAHTGRTLDEGRLTEAVNKTNEAREIALDMFNLARSVPSQVKGRDLLAFGLALPLMLGTQEAVDLVRAYRDEFAARVQGGTSGVPDERHRLIWLQEPIQFKNPLIKMLEEEHHASVVIEETNDIYWGPIDPDDPFTGFARRAISFPPNGPFERRLKHIKKLVEAYRVDGAINPCHWGCRQGTGSRGLVAQALRELGIPVINLEVDCADSRNFAEGQLRTRLEAFMEVLNGAGGGRSVKTGGQACITSV